MFYGMKGDEEEELQYLIGNEPLIEVLRKICALPAIPEVNYGLTFVSIKTNDPEMAEQTRKVMAEMLRESKLSKFTVTYNGQMSRLNVFHSLKTIRVDQNLESTLEKLNIPNTKPDKRQPKEIM